MTFRFIEDTETLASVCEQLGQDSSYIAFDTEFLRERTYWAHLCLIQMATPKGSFIIDPLCIGSLDPLIPLLRDETIVKVFHAAHQDIEILYRLFKFVPHPIFDTQVAAMACGFRDGIGYGDLIKSLLGISIDKTHTTSHWERRPLDILQLKYAAGDVEHLCAIYEKLMEILTAKGRVEWLKEENRLLEDVCLYDVDTSEAWRCIKSKKKTLHFGVLKNLAQWREEEARRKNQPRRYVLRDEVIVFLAKTLPHSLEDIKNFRDAPHELFKDPARLQALLACVRASQEEGAPEPHLETEPKKLSSRQMLVCEALALLLKIVCVKEGLAPRLVATSRDIKSLVCAQGDDDDNTLLKGWRYDIFGREAVRFRDGCLFLSCEDGELCLQDKKRD